MSARDNVNEVVTYHYLELLSSATVNNLALAALRLAVLDDVTLLGKAKTAEACQESLARVIKRVSEVELSAGGLQTGKCPDYKEPGE